MKRYLFFSIILLAFAKDSSALISVNPNASAVQIANMIFGSGNIVSNVVFNGAPGSCGTFSGGSSINLGESSGAVLTTGRANYVPNACGFTASVQNFMPGDQTLNGITAQQTHDCASIEFDVIPVCSPLKVKFVFASEEYPEWVFQYNDGFGIFITGPNPNGWPYTNYNIARLPNPATTITINHVNQSTNSAYFVDNSGGSVGFVYDGLTVPISASIDVFSCTVYHVRISIADADDDYYDSAVFLEKENSSCPPPFLIVSPTVHMCPEDVAILTASGADHYIWSPSYGLDTTEGETVMASPSTTITYTVFAFMGCDTADGTSAEITVDLSGPLVEISPTSSSIMIGDSITLTASGGGDYVWWPGGQTSSSITVSPTETTTFVVIGTGYSGNWSCVDSATAIVVVYSDIFVPNAFTPNGDGTNDVFIPEGEILKSDLSGYEFLIFDRWGNCIFKTQDIYSGWDGRIRERDAEEGIYVWLVRIGDTYHYGHVSLIR